MTRYVISAVLSVFIGALSVGSCWSQARVPQSADDLVVMIETTDDLDARNVGAGIVVGGQPNGLVYILTAKHLLIPPGSTVAIREVTVEFPQLRNNKLTAIMLPTIFDDGVDLAVVAIAAKDAPEEFRTGSSLMFGRVSEIPTNGEQVRVVGQMGGKPWSSTGLTNTVASSASTEIRIEGPAVEPGASGGAVIDDEGLIIGIVSEGERGFFNAIPMRLAAEQFSAFKLPFMLENSYGRAFTGERMDREFFKPSFGSISERTRGVWFDAKTTIAIEARQLEYSFDGIRYKTSHQTERLFLEEGESPKRMFFRFTSRDGRIFGPFEYETGFEDIGTQALIEKYHRPEIGNTAILPAKEGPFDVVVAAEENTLSIFPLLNESLASFRVDFGDGFLEPREMRNYGGGVDIDVGRDLATYETGIQTMKIEALGPTGERYGTTTFEIDLGLLLKTSWLTKFDAMRAVECAEIYGPSGPEKACIASMGNEWAGIERVELGFTPAVSEYAADISTDFAAMTRLDSPAGSYSNTKWQNQLFSCREARPECPVLFRIAADKSHVYVRYKLFDGRWTDVHKLPVQ